jgi:hypothetical protein
VKMLHRPIDGTDWVVITVAVAIGTAFNMVTFAVLWDALFSNEAGLSDNATQVLTGWGGGIIGIIGAYIGSQTNRAEHNHITHTYRGDAMTDTLPPNENEDDAANTEQVERDRDRDESDSPDVERQTVTERTEENVAERHDSDDDAGTGSDVR